MPVRPNAALVLGMLRLGAQTGYDIKKAVDVSTRYFWSTSYAQVYPELARLAEHGLVTRREEPRGARPRSAYSVTRDGEAALLDWLRSPRQVLPTVRAEAALRLFLADALPKEEQLELVRRMREAAEQVAARIGNEIVPLAVPFEEQGLRFPGITARFGADVWAFAADWLSRLERELE
jgi:DNA-binding PadR family transcriptional regulator